MERLIGFAESLYHRREFGQASFDRLRSRLVFGGLGLAQMTVYRL